MDCNLGVLVAGAGGFIGGHLAAHLRRTGFQRIRAVDIKPLGEWYQCQPGIESLSLDLRDPTACRQAVSGMQRVYNLAADMGGIGFIHANKAQCMLSVLINTHLLTAAREAEVERFFFASSACVYNTAKQSRTDSPGLKEEDAYPAMPEDGYGWEKLFSERMCRHFAEDYGLAARIVRYHNVYGPCGAFDGGREKAPAAICRKIAAAKLGGGGTIEIWGDGEQTRSFMHIDDCIFGSSLIMDSAVCEPINLGSDRMVTINQLVDIVERIAGVRLRRKYNPEAPSGVRGRNSDNALIRRLLGWAPRIPLEEGLEETYRWVYDQMRGKRAERVAVPRVA